MAEGESRVIAMEFIATPVTMKNWEMIKAEYPVDPLIRDNLVDKYAVAWFTPSSDHDVMTWMLIPLTMFNKDGRCIMPGGLIFMLPREDLIQLDTHPLVRTGRPGSLPRTIRPTDPVAKITVQVELGDRWGKTIIQGKRIVVQPDPVDMQADISYYLGELEAKTMHELQIQLAPSSTRRR